MTNDRPDSSPAGADDPTASRRADAESRFSAFEGATEDFGIGPGGADPLIGADIGGVTIVRLIGQGGMGRVYEARQSKPSRPVAVKVIRPGVVSEAHMRRFDHEAEILARLRHPGIAQIHTVGTYHSPAGDVPFFVMEYIPDARSLVEFADHHRLSTHDRLDLFRKVCDAVAHGHTRGVVHRDLKPSNILVDATGQPKVIDFGVAKTTDVDLALTTMRTDVGQLIGTLQYMSPEQFDGQPDEVDVRSDVYALGVVLYELLAGQPPYDIRRKAVIEAARVVKEEDPTPLSSLNRTLRRDVGVIAGKCLAKEPGARYSSAAELGADVGRYLAGEPIHASPPGFIDGVIRLARRHKAAAAAVGAVATSLVAAVVGISLFAVKAERQTQEARKSAKVATHKQNVSDLNRFHLLQERDDPANAFALLDDIEKRFTPENIPVEVRVTRSEADDAITVFPGRSFEFSPDGSLLVISGALEDHAEHLPDPLREYAYLVDAHSGKRIVRLEEPRGGCVDGSPRFSRDGSRVAFATSDRELTEVESDVNSGMNFAFSSVAGQRGILTPWGSRGACIWDARTAKLCKCFDDPQRSLMYPDWLPSSRPAEVDPDTSRAVFVEGLGTDNCSLRIHAGDSVSTVVLERSGETADSIASGLSPEWDAEFAIDHMASRVAIADGRAIQLWDLPRAVLIATLWPSHKSKPVFSPDGNRLLLCTPVPARDLEFTDLKDFATRHEVPLDMLAVDADDWSLWTSFSLWDTATGQQLSSFIIPEYAFDEMDGRERQTFAFSPDSELLVIAGNTFGKSPQHTRSFFEVRSGCTGQLIRRSWLGTESRQPSPITHCAFSPSGKSLIVCRDDGVAFPWERTAENALNPVPFRHFNQLAGDKACFSQDDTKMACRSGHEMRVFQRTESAPGKPCFEPLARLRCRSRTGEPRFSPDGTRLAATLGDRHVALWAVDELGDGLFDDRGSLPWGLADAGFQTPWSWDRGRWCFDNPLLAFTGGISSIKSTPAPVSVYRVSERGAERFMVTPRQDSLSTQSSPQGSQHKKQPIDGLLLDGPDERVVLTYGQQTTDFSNQERGLPEFTQGVHFLFAPHQLDASSFFRSSSAVGWRSTLTKYRFGVRVLSTGGTATIATHAVNALSPTGKFGLTWSPPELIELSTGRSWALPELSPNGGAACVECSWSANEEFLAVAANHGQNGDLTIYKCANRHAPYAVAHLHCVGGIGLLQETGVRRKCQFTFATAGERVLWRDDDGQRVFRSAVDFGRNWRSRDSQGSPQFFNLFDSELTHGVTWDEGSISVWDLERKCALGTFEHSVNKKDFAVQSGAPTGYVLDGRGVNAIIYGWGSPVLWSAKKPNGSRVVTSAGHAWAAAFSPDGSRIAVLGNTPGGVPKLLIVDPTTAETLGEWRLEQDYDRVTFVNDGRHILTYGIAAKLWGLSKQEIHAARSPAEGSSVVLASEFDAWHRLDGPQFDRVIHEATCNMTKQDQRAVRNAFLRLSATRDQAHQQERLAAKRSRLQPIVDKVCPPVRAANRKRWETLEASVESPDDIDDMIDSQLSVVQGEVQEEDRAELARMIERRLEEMKKGPM